MSIFFSSLDVRTLTRLSMTVQWSIQDTPIPRERISFEVLRSNAPGGPFDQVLAPSIDTFIHVDEMDAHQRSRERSWWYKIVARDTASDVMVESPPKTMAFKPDRQLLSIINRHHILLSRPKGGIGVWTAIFIERTFGAECTVCWDAVKQRETASGCDECFDTGVSGGYLNQINAFVAFDPATKVTQLTGFGEINPDDRIAWLSNFPLLKQRDILVNPINERYRVKRIRHTKLRGAISRQVLHLEAVNVNDIVQNIRVQEVPLPARGRPVVVTGGVSAIHHCPRIRDFSPKRIEKITPQIDNVKTSFNTAEAYIAGSLEVYLEGLFQGPALHTEVDNRTFSVPVAPTAGQRLEVIYERDKADVAEGSPRVEPMPVTFSGIVDPIKTDIARTVSFQGKRLENLNSQVDGVVMSFATAEKYAPGSLEVYLDGLLVARDDVTETGQTTFSLATSPLVSEDLEIIYIRAVPTLVEPEVAPVGALQGRLASISGAEDFIGETQEDLSVQVDGVLVEFVTPTKYRTGTLRVFINKVYQGKSFHTEVDDTTFSVPTAPLLADTLEVQYVLGR